MVDSRIQVEPAPIGLGRSILVKFKVQVAKRQIALRIGTLHLSDEFVGQIIFAREDGIPHRGQVAQGVRVGRVARIA